MFHAAKWMHGPANLLINVIKWLLMTKADEDAHSIYVHSLSLSSIIIFFIPFGTIPVCFPLTTVPIPNQGQCGFWSQSQYVLGTHPGQVAETVLVSYLNKVTTH